MKQTLKPEREDQDRISVETGGNPGEVIVAILDHVCEASLILTYAESVSLVQMIAGVAGNEAPAPEDEEGIEG